MAPQSSHADPPAARATTTPAPATTTTRRAARPATATPPGATPMRPQPATIGRPRPIVQGAPVQAPTLALERYTLPNGLEVILHEDHRTPTVAVNLWYHVGSKDEPQGRNGFAHLFEHLMFQGSRHVPEDTFFLHLERAGASNINGTTGDDRTNYYETVPSGRLNLALWLESDRMAYLLDHVDQPTFESQRSVVLNERRQNYENAPYGNVSRYLREANYPRTHPYYRLPIGTPEDLNAATLDDVRQFFRTWYVPNNATLVVAGDIQPAAARALIEQYFGPIVRGADVPRRPQPEPVRVERQTRIEVESSAELPRVYMSWVTPPLFAPGDAELDMVANVLAGGRSARLYRRLVHDMQIAQEVVAAQSSSQLGSTFEIIATARPGHTPEEILRVIDEELQHLRESPPEEAELARARTEATTGIVLDTERVASRANRFNTYNQIAGDPNYLARDVTRYQSPTADDLRNTTRTFLPADRRVIVMVYPTPGAPLAGRIRGAQPSNNGSQTGGAQ